MSALAKLHKLSIAAKATPEKRITLIAVMSPGANKPWIDNDVNCGNCKGRRLFFNSYFNECPVQVA